MELSRGGPGFYEALVDLAQGPSFPFFEMILDETNKAQSPSVTLLVSPTIRKQLMSIYKTDRLLFYVDILGGKIEAWTPDMLESMRILRETGVMSAEAQWILKARSYVNNFLTGTVGERPKSYEGEKAIEFLREVLAAGGILGKVDSDPKLLAIASDVVRSGRKDLDSCIYRFAMALYHSRGFSGRSAVSEIDDPGAAYLGIISNSNLQTRFPKLVESISSWPTERRTDITKTFICFCIAGYLCHRAAGEVSK